MIKLTEKGQYAVTAMLDLAIRQDRGYVTLQDLEKCQGISGSYLEKLFALLRRKGLVTAARGPGGGYRLGRHAQDISVADVIVAVGDCAESPAQTLPCSDDFAARLLWEELVNELKDYLDTIDLAAILERRH